MSTKQHPIIAFRHQVREMTEAGAFKAPEDALLYSIKERQASEINVQLQAHRLRIYQPHPTFYGQGSEIVGNHLANVFFREDYLSPDDYSYFISDLNSVDRSFVLASLVENKAPDHDLIRGEKSPWIKAFLEDYATREFSLPQSGHVKDVFQKGSLIALLATYFPDPQKAAALHLGIERALEDKDTRPYRHHIEVIHLKQAIELAGPTEMAQWLINQHVLEGLRAENQKTVVGHRQVNTLLNQTNAYQAIKALPEPDKLRLSPVIACIEKMINQDMVLLISVLQQPASKAIEAFGKADTKGEGKRIAENLVNFADLMETSAVEPALRKQALGLMVTKVCEVNQKNLVRQEVSAFIQKVKDQVDWKELVTSMNGKGRAVLMEAFQEAEYYRPYLKRDERGRNLESELGL
jgi:hypothetical protein